MEEKYQNHAILKFYMCFFFYLNIKTHMIEKNICWMFSIILLLMILISIFGGSIRYRENFLDEITGYELESGVADNNDYASISLPSSNDMIEEEQQDVNQDIEEENVIQEENIVQENQEPDSKNPSVEKEAIKLNYDMSIIEGFSGDEWASSQW